MSKPPKDPGMAAFSGDQVEPPTPAGEQPPPEPEGPIDPADPSEPTTDQLADDEGPVFDVEAFVKALPEGIGLCPLCLGLGASASEAPYDPTVHVCPTCIGWGKLQLPSHVGGQVERECSTCQGHGWLPDDPTLTPARPAQPTDFAGELPPVDQQGRTPDDPAFDWSKVVAQVVPMAPEAAAEPPVPAI